VTTKFDYAASVNVKQLLNDIVQAAWSNANLLMLYDAQHQNQKLQTPHFRRSESESMCNMFRSNSQRNCLLDNKASNERMTKMKIFCPWNCHSKLSNNYILQGYIYNNSLNLKYRRKRS